MAGNLKRQKLIHSGEKPFKCLQCIYSCTTAGSLKKHLLIHSLSKLINQRKHFQGQFCYIHISFPPNKLLSHGWKYSHTKALTSFCVSTYFWKSATFIDELAGQCDRRSMLLLTFSLNPKFWDSNFTWKCWIYEYLKPHLWHILYQFHMNRIMIFTIRNIF